MFLFVCLLYFLGFYLDDEEVGGGGDGFGEAQVVAPAEAAGRRRVARRLERNGVGLAETGRRDARRRAVVAERRRPLLSSSPQRTTL